MEKSKNELKIIEKYTFIFLAVIIICQLLVITLFGVLKKSYFVDEIHTFGLSNSYYKPFITWNEEPNSWHDKEFYLNFLTVQDDERFAYNSVYYNQVHDVHPPLYYIGIHTLCSFFPNIFSKWLGIIFNMFFFSGTIIFLFLLSKLIFEDKLLSIVICIAYGFSSGAISHTIFIRMYMMLTFFIVVTTYLHGLLIENPEIKFIIIIIIINTIGFLTQYLFIIYAFFIAFGYTIYLFKLNRWKEIILYLLGMIVFIWFSIVLFPELLSHIFFEDMGTNVISNFNTINDFLIRIWWFVLLLCKSMIIFPLALLIFLTIKPYYSKNKENFDNSRLSNENISICNKTDDKKIIFKTIVYSTILSFLVIIKIAPYLGLRYISYLFPNIALISIIMAYSKLLNYLNERKIVIKFLTLLIGICYIFSYVSGGVQYLYTNITKTDDILSEIFNYDAYSISSNIHYNTSVIPLIMNHNRSQFINDDNKIISIISSNKTEEPVILYFPNLEDKDEEDSDIKILKNIIENSEYNTYKRLVKKSESVVNANIYLLE